MEWHRRAKFIFWALWSAVETSKPQSRKTNGKSRAEGRSAQQTTWTHSFEQLQLEGMVEMIDTKELMEGLESPIRKELERMWDQWSGHYNLMVESRDHWLSKYAKLQVDMEVLERELDAANDVIDTIKKVTR